MKPLTLLSATCVAAALMVLPAIAASEEDVVECPPGTPHGTICLGEREIFGILHRPSTVYVIQRTRLVHDQQAADQSFTEEVVESVDHDPF